MVEVDETCVGGKEGNKQARDKLHAGRGVVGKTAAVGMTYRDKDKGNSAQGPPQMQYSNVSVQVKSAVSLAD